MQIQQITLHRDDPYTRLDELAGFQPHLVLVFGAVAHFTQTQMAQAMAQTFPDAVRIGCSTAGEIGPEGVSDDALVVSALRFDQPGLCSASTTLTDMADSAGAGARIARSLKGEGLHNVLIFGPGVNINGSALIQGFREEMGDTVLLSGGLAGDGGAFKETWTLGQDGCASNQVVAVGFRSPSIRLHHSSFHGWVPFGPERKVTRAAGNILYELDGKSALTIYKEYLGDYARDLPASGLLFPLEMLGPDRSGAGLIRTILGVDEAAGSLILAGDILEDGYLRLMHANTDSLVDGAETAAENISVALDNPDSEALALLVSCVGRKLVMGFRVDEEVEAVADIFGKQARVGGFYSYGEISPVAKGIDCKLHNQTMTITHISEA